MLANDVTAIRQIVLGNLPPPPDPSSQYQRTDVNIPCGNALIEAGDVTVIRNYALGNPAPPPACGPTGSEGNRPESEMQTVVKPPVESNATTTATNRELRVGPATGRRGETVTMPVFMKMDADEIAALFTLEYDATRLSNPRLTLGTGLPESTVLTTNTAQPGKIGVLIDAETRLSATPRELRIVFVTFDVRNTAAIGLTQINITDSLAPRSVSDTRARLLVTGYVNGGVTVTN